MRTSSGNGTGTGTYTANGTFTLNHTDGLVRAGSVILANNVGTSTGGTKNVTGRFNLNAGTLEAATITHGTGGNAVAAPEFNFSGGTVRNAVGQNLTISNVPVKLITGADPRIFEATAGQTITVASNAVISGTGLGCTKAGGGFGIDRLANIDWDSLLTGTSTLVSGNIDFANIRNVGLSNAFLLDSGYSAYFQEGSLQLVITPVPESSTFVILAAGAGILGLRATRRRQAK